MQQLIRDILFKTYHGVSPTLQPLLRRSYYKTRPILRKIYSELDKTIYDLQTFLHGPEKFIEKMILEQNPQCSSRLLKIIKKGLQEQKNNNFSPTLLSTLDSKFVNKKLRYYEDDHTMIYDQEKKYLDDLIAEAGHYSECFDTLVFLCLHYREILYYKLAIKIDSLDVSGANNDLSPFVYAMQ